jgi:hypothetical protein
VTQSGWFAAVLLLAACGGAAAPAPAKPSTSAAGTVQGFMQAVADSNLAKMAALWGTAKGPAAQTNDPPDWERRVAIMRSYLRNEASRIVSDAPDGDARHAVQVELRRETCTWVVPFTVIKLADGSWIVNQVDLAAAGNPMRPCQEATQEDTTAK